MLAAQGALEVEPERAHQGCRRVRFRQFDPEEHEDQPGRHEVVGEPVGCLPAQFGADEDGPLGEGERLAEITSPRVVEGQVVQ